MAREGDFLRQNSVYKGSPWSRAVNSTVWRHRFREYADNVSPKYMMIPVADHLQMRQVRNFREHSSSPPADDMENFMPWMWILETLLDVEKLSLPFFRDMIEYLQPHIVQPQCSRLLQKVALRYLDDKEATPFPRKLDPCDILLLRFLLKEQGVSNLSSRIHSLKESRENDLSLRVETEAVLTNLRCDGKERSTADWEAFEASLHSVFSEGMLDPRSAERRKELISVLQDRSKAQCDEHVCEELLGRFPLGELYRDLASFVDDKRKFFKIKFLDQVSKDVENNVYSFSPGSNSPEPRDGTTLPGSTSNSGQNDKHIAVQEDGNIDAGKCLLADARVSEIMDVREEMTLGIAEVDEVSKELSKDTKDFVNDVTQFTEHVQPSASMPVLFPDVINQQFFSPAAPIAGSVFSMQQNRGVICPAKRDEVHLEIDELMEDQWKSTTSADCLRSEPINKCIDRDTKQTSRMSSERVTRRRSNQIIDQVTAVTKKKKVNDFELSIEHRNQSAAAEKESFRSEPIMHNTFGAGPSKERLSSEDMEIAGIRVLDTCNAIDRDVGKNLSTKHGHVCHDEAGSTLGESNLPIANAGDGELNSKCCLCESIGGCQLYCHKCSESIHEGCLSKLCSRQVDGQSGWYCFSCASRMALEGLKSAQEVETAAKTAVREKQEEVLATQERLAAFVRARNERSREPHDRQDFVGFSQGTPCGNVMGTNDQNTSLVHAVQDSTEDSRPDPEVGEKTMLPKRSIITKTSVPLSGSPLRNVMHQNAIRQSCRTTQDTEIPTAPEATVLRGGLNADIRNHRPGQGLPRERVGGEGSTSFPPMPVSQSLSAGGKHNFGYCAQEQSEGPGCPADIRAPLISDANDSHMKSGPEVMIREDVGATKVAINGIEAPVDHGGHSSPSHYLPFNARNLEDEGEARDGDLEQSCEGNRAAENRINVVEPVVISEKISESATVREHRRPRKVYRLRTQIPGVRRKNLPWTDIEEDALKEGVNMFSRDGEWGFQWKRILEFGVGKFHESRTAVDLKDKWRNLQSKKL